MSKKIYGIDTLYFYCISNEYYDNLYQEIQKQLANQKEKFESENIEYDEKDLYIKINDIHLNYRRKAEGFHWFKDVNGFFRIGFKSIFKNQTQNDIRVQLEGLGIYTVGIKSILNLIDECLLKGYIKEDKPITRVDLNCFIQYDFSFATKEMFSTRKRNYGTISEIGSATKTQTLYVGKSPFRLRLYNKKEELKKSKKKELMNEYFLSNGFNLEEEIFNVEFEFHRTHLKTFKISTIKDLFSNAKKLFQIAMNDIRLIDISTLSENSVKHNNKHRAKTLEIWNEIREDYSLDGFLQSSLPLERIKRKISIYDDYKFKIEYIALIRKAFINNLHLDGDFISELFVEGKESLRKTTTNKEFKKKYTPVDVIDSKGKKEELRLLEDGNLIKPINIKTVANLQNYDLLAYLDKTSKKQHLSTKDEHIHYVALKEAKKRNLVLDLESKKGIL